MFNECRHILPSGYKCKSPALRGQALCYFHTGMRRFAENRKQLDKEPLALPSLEDTAGVQIALMQVLGTLGTERMDPRRAGLYLYGLQIASRLAEKSGERSRTENVRALCYENDGDVFGPDQTVCEPPEDCTKCQHPETCNHPRKPRRR